MAVETAFRNWALLVALVLASAIAIFVLWRVFSESVPGQLRNKARQFARRCREADQAGVTVDKASEKLEKLRANADSIKPRHGREAADALDDARSLCKIAQDKVLIAETQLSGHIADEYPPNQHQAMRLKYLTRPR